MSGGGGGGIGGAIGNVVGTIIGGGTSSGDRAKGQGYAEQAFNELTSIGVPPDLSKEIILQKFQQAGILTPEMEKQIDLAHSKQAELKEAPETRQAQMQALQQLQQLGKTGLGAQDKAALAKIKDQVQSNLEGKRQQILQNMQARGMGGSGAELIAQLQGAQSGANSEAQQGLDVAAQAQNRALQALTQGSSLAGQVRGQDYSVASNRAQAEDEMNRFNVQNQLTQQTRNVGAQNQAQQQNLAQQQAMMNSNVAQANQEKLRQSDAQRQNWLDQVTRAKVRSGGFNDAAQEYSNRANQQMQNQQNLWGGIGTIAGTGAGMAFGVPSGGGATPLTGNTDEDYYKYMNPNTPRYAHGGIVPGKAEVRGDIVKNDKVPAMLSPGEVVIPKEIMEHKNAPEEAKKFIHRILGSKKD